MAKQTFFEFLWYKFFNLTSIKAGNAAVPQASMSFLFLKNFGRDSKVFEDFAKYYATYHFTNKSLQILRNELLHINLCINFEVTITILAMWLVGAARLSSDSHSDSHWLPSDYNIFFQNQRLAI